MKQKWNRPPQLFLFLLLIVLLLGSLNVAKAKGWLIPSQPVPPVNGKIISLNSLTLDQKIAQMIIVAGARQNVPAWKKLQVGGIHLFALQNEQLFHDTIAEVQEGMAIPFFVTVDLEGCRNPFATFREFTAASNIRTEGQAFEKGSEEGKFLAALGISINFAPVVDLEDTIWHCRSFPGNETHIAELAEAYVLGLQKEGIMATAKHYPGKTLVVRDPHKFIVTADISPEDLFPYYYLAKKQDLKAVMVSHIIPSGAVVSTFPSVASADVVQHLRQNFGGLIITDEVNMLGLKNFYPTLEVMYLAIVEAGNDLILNFNDDPQEIYHMIQVIKAAVEEGRIPQERIDASVQKILEAKGFTVI